jgi:hypothetical protein
MLTASRQMPFDRRRDPAATERHSLELSRTRVLKDLDGATHPRCREQLEAALRHLDQKLAELKWTRYRRSRTIAIPCPTPMHMVQRAYRPPVFRSCEIAVVISLAPLVPNG